MNQLYYVVESLNGMVKLIPVILGMELLISKKLHLNALKVHPYEFFI